MLQDDVRWSPVSPLILWLAGLAACTASPEAPTEPREPSGSLTTTFANDLFAGSDNNFTAAWSFAWTSNDVSHFDETSFWPSYADFWSFLPALGDEGARRHVTFGFGQTIATPSDITDPNPPLDDQPYAGLLAASTAVHSVTDASQHSWWLLAGVVGPSSRAEQVQKTIHALTGSDEPQGWDTQLGDEPVVNAYYDWKRRLAGGPGPAWGGDLTSSLGGGLGNLWIGGWASLFARLGYRLPDDYGPSVPRTGLGGFPIRIQPRDPPWRVYGFVGLDAQWVGRNLFLDGSTFEDSRSVEREPFVATASFGIGIQKGAFVLNWLAYSQTDSYATQVDANRFGTVAISSYY